MENTVPFNDFFYGLWGHEPFPWQKMLAAQLLENPWPCTLDLPTASGKTACMDIAVWSLAAQSFIPVSERTAPRRIWFVVDRRLVVDEAFERASKLSEKLMKAKNGPLRLIADSLRAISGTGVPLAVGRLRGGVFSDDGWARVPSQPAVITSTVDQVGSRILFRGYGRSQATAPIFAGLAANDSLILLDEAHCSVPFMQTLRSIQNYNSEKWAESPVKTPFAFAVLSATQPLEVFSNTVFPGEKRDQALSHPVLQERIRASKPAILVTVTQKKSKKDTKKDQDPFVTELMAKVTCALKNPVNTKIAVIVNRVKIAIDTATRLRDELSENADIVLFTGKIRPVERDQLIAKWSPYLKSNKVVIPSKPIVVIATQCLEVGADFSFNAMITEAASLDALRQRFGRLNRLGKDPVSYSWIVIRSEHLAETSSDPIYGEAMRKCWEFLNEHARSTEEESEEVFVDFGIEAMDRAIGTRSLTDDLLAPTPFAPTLLPAHLDLLVQTSPTPGVEPDIQLYLHGSGKGSTEVGIVWRSDLSKISTDKWIETVTLCPPSLGETLPVPIWIVKTWLIDAAIELDDSDIEGQSNTNPVTQDQCPHILIWGGRDRSQVVNHTRDIQPNDIIFVPEEYGMIPIGQSEPFESLGTKKLDLWESARIKSGRPPAIRLNRMTLKPWLNIPGVEELVATAEEEIPDRDCLKYAIDNLQTSIIADSNKDQAFPEWLLSVLKKVRGGRMEKHPGGGLVLFASSVSSGSTVELDLYADEDDLLSAEGREITIQQHVESVCHAVSRIAGKCLDTSFTKPFQIAALWHDQGKADERFQIMLRRGDSVATAAGELLAKSIDVPKSATSRQRVRVSSSLPENFRHEMLSMQFAEKYAFKSENDEWFDLIMHLVSSHHGYGRPFAPICYDETAPSVLSTINNLHIHITAEERSEKKAHRTGSGIPERFWKLNRKHGWWGLAYMESIFRLSDWYGSMHAVSGPPPHVAENLTDIDSQQSKRTSDDYELELAGIDGANPLAFLAAMGAFAVLNDEGFRNVRMGWRQSAVWVPVLKGISGLKSFSVSEIIAARLKEEKRPELDLGIAPNPAERVIDCDRERFLKVYKDELASSSYRHRYSSDIIASVISDGCLDLDFKDQPKKNKNNQDKLDVSPFCFITGSGHQYYLGTLHGLIDKISPERIHSVLFDFWTHADEGLSFRWDPIEDRRYALMEMDPTDSKNKARTEWMANLLAHRSFSLFSSAPRRRKLQTAGWMKPFKGDPCFSWPIWSDYLDMDTVRSLLSYPELVRLKPDASMLFARDIVTVFRARRIRVGSGANFKVNFSPARRI